MNENNNQPAKKGSAVKITGIVIMVIGILVGLFFLGEDIDNKFGIFLMYAGTSTISGIFFIALSEIIELLDDIKNKLNK